jgi:hypothetical protein
MSDRQWTIQAMHLACAMARNTHARLVLLHLRPIKNPALLGSDVGLNALSDSEYDDLEEYGMVAEDYGVTLTVQPMAYESWVDALVQTAEYLNASVLFAHPSGQANIVWHWFQRWQQWILRRQLASHHCHLYTLDLPMNLEETLVSVAIEA